MVLIVIGCLLFYRGIGGNLRHKRLYEQNLLQAETELSVDLSSLRFRRGMRGAELQHILLFAAFGQQGFWNDLVALAKPATTGLSAEHHERLRALLEQPFQGMAKALRNLLGGVVCLTFGAVPGVMSTIT